MKYESYIQKLEMIKKQYNNEEALTPIIYQLIDSDDYSTMVVQNARGEKGYYGISSNPDLAILSKDFVYENEYENFQLDKMLGCVEIKKLGAPLIPNINDLLIQIKREESKNKDNKEILEKIPTEHTAKDLGQLLGEILWYRKVLYTNGYCWTLLDVEFSTGYSQETYLTEVTEFAKSEYDNFIKTKKNANDEMKDEIRKEGTNWFGRLSATNWIKNISIRETKIISKNGIDEITKNDYTKMTDKLNRIKW